MSLEMRTTAEPPVHHVPGLKILYWMAVLMAMIAVQLYGLLAIFVVPAPSAESAFLVSGTVAGITKPHSEGEDMWIKLSDGRSFYVNRPRELPYFAWEQLLEDVQPGDTIYLTAVKNKAQQWLTGQNLPTGGPVAGVKTEDRVYLNDTIPATTWHSQKTVTQNAMISAVVLLLLLILPFAIKRFSKK